MEHIERALAGMWGTPDRVAEAIRAVRGLRGSTSSLNPVVHYLNRTVDIGGRVEVEVGGSVLRLRRGNKVSESAPPRRSGRSWTASTAAYTPIWRAGDGCPVPRTSEKGEALPC